jgi:hypothetical protein
MATAACGDVTETDRKGHAADDDSLGPSAAQPNSNNVPDAARLQTAVASADQRREWRSIPATSLKADAAAPANEQRVDDFLPQTQPPSDSNSTPTADGLHRLPAFTAGAGPYAAGGWYVVSSQSASARSEPSDLSKQASADEAHGAIAPVGCCGRSASLAARGAPAQQDLPFAEAQKAVQQARDEIYEAAPGAAAAQQGNSSVQPPDSDGDPYVLQLLLAVHHYRCACAAALATSRAFLYLRPTPSQPRPASLP